MTDYNLLVGEAIKIAVVYHEGQIDKSGRPYIQHPLRVSNGLKCPKHKIVAILHDIYEDTDIPKGEVKRLFGDEIENAVLAITKIEGEKLDSYLDRVKSNQIALKAKLEDIADNTSFYRLSLLPIEKVLRLVEKYHYCYNYLKS